MRSIQKLFPQFRANHKILILFILVLAGTSVWSQTDSSFKKMDFLIGQWKFDAKSYIAENQYQQNTFYSSVSYIFGGTASKDDFSYKDQNGNLITYGTTIRTYDRQSQKWKMLWYNYNLSFITEMTGSYTNGEFHFTGKGSDQKGNYIEKITFYNISQDQYSWKNDKSYDGGKTWLKNFFSYTAYRITDKE